MPISCILRRLFKEIKTHACVFDMFGDFSEKRHIVFRILAAYENFERNLSAFQRLQVFS